MWELRAITAQDGTKVTELVAEYTPEQEYDATRGLIWLHNLDRTTGKNRALVLVATHPRQPQLNIATF